MKRDLNIDVPIASCYRAKKDALYQFFGSYYKQYRLTRRYALVVLNTNPERWSILPNICLDACKNGFKYGCRPIICLDACHLKGKYRGQLLCAIGKDGNEDMFPIQFAVAKA